MRLVINMFSGVRAAVAVPMMAGLAVGAATVGCGGKGETPAANEPAAEGAAASAKKIGEAEYKAFGDALKVEGFEPQGPIAVSGMGARASLAAKPKDNGAKAQLEIAYSACDSFICPKLDLESVKANQDNLKRNLPPIVLQHPQLVHEIFELDIGGKKVIGVYTLYMTVTTTADGTSKFSANSIDLTWHDNTQLVTIESNVTDWDAENQTQLAERTPRAELETIAKAAFEAAQKAIPK